MAEMSSESILHARISQYISAEQRGYNLSPLLH